MQGLRPKFSNFHIERPRLLNALPEEAGYVVWLEAPYGYGKSVLASQWADKLEEDNWRIYWLSLAGRDPKSALSKMLNLPEFAPWGIILEQLWEQPSLLILEDLTGDEDLSPLFKNISGLILLASRNKLSYSELPRLIVEQKLQHFTSETIGFNHSEAEALFIDQKKAHEFWEQTQGWPLPLHFAALTGQTPETDALLSGMKTSLSPQAWQEALFLATMSYLPQGSGNEATQELEKAGFVQPLTDGHRLHPLVAEAIKNTYAGEVKAIVIKEAKRLEPFERALVFETVEYFEGLHDLIADQKTELYRNVPARVIIWHHLLPKPISVACLANVAIAQLQLDKIDSGLVNVTTVINSPDASLKLKLSVLCKTINCLANANRNEDIPPFLKQAEDLLQLLESDAHYQMAEFLSAKAIYYFSLGDNAKAEETVLEALKELDQDSLTPNKHIIEMSIKHFLHRFRFERTGDVRSSLNFLKSGLETHFPNSWNYWINVMNIGITHMHLNELHEAQRYMDKLLTSKNEFFIIFAKLVKSYLAKDIDALILIHEECKVWQYYDLAHGASAVLLRGLRSSGINETTIERAFSFQETIIAGPYTDIEYAHFEKARANTTTALELLENSKRNGFIDMHHKFLWWAAHYLITREEASIDALLKLTTSGSQLFPYLLIPLDTLPKHRPELSQGYPLEEVLNSEWQEAIEYRIAELPPLKIKLLGEFTVLLLDKPIELTDRVKQILCLMVLGHSRAEIASLMWPEADKKKSKNNLYVQLNLLKKAIEPWGISSYLFESELRNTTIDLLELQNALKQNDATTVLEFYKEPFVPNIYVNNIDDFREVLRQDVIECLFDNSSKASDDTARRYLERIMELDANHEEALQALLKLLLKKGRRHEAMKRYKKFEMHLKAEMGLEPLPSTQAILNT